MRKCITGLNDLYTWCINNGSHGKYVLELWTGFDVDNNIIDIHNIAAKSNKKVKLKCKNGHTFNKMVYDITKYKPQCKYCRSSLLDICNKIQIGNELKEEWTGITYNCDVIYNMCDVSPNTHKKFLWKCKAGHTWYATPHNRISHETHCPKCKIHGTSYPEQFLYNAIKLRYKSTENRTRVLKNIYKGGIEFDIGIPEIKTCIEYSATGWHRGRDEIDNLKIDICNKYGIRLIRIIEDSYDEYDEYDLNDTIIFRMKHSKKDETIIRLTNRVLELLNDKALNENEIQYIKNEATFSSRLHIKYEKSLEYNSSRLSKEWHKTLNKLKPSEVSAHSHLKAYWQCSSCGYGSNGEWETYIYSRNSIRGISKCPLCGN